MRVPGRMRLGEVSTCLRLQVRLRVRLPLLQGLTAGKPPKGYPKLSPSAPHQLLTSRALRPIIQKAIINMRFGCKSNLALVVLAK